MTSPLRSVLLLALLALAAGCGSEEQSQAPRETTLGEEVGQTVDHAGKALAKARETAVAELEAELRDLRPKLEALEASARDATAEAKAALAAALEDLRSEEGVVRRKMDELKAAGDKAWTRVLQETRDAARVLAERCDRALEERAAARTSGK